MNILLVEHQGRCTRNGEAVGHSNKVLDEYGKMLSDVAQIDVAASPCVIEKVQHHRFQKEIKLKYDIIKKAHISILERITNKLKEFRNIWDVMQMPYKTIWFYNADFYLFLFFMFYGNKSKRLYCLLCAQKYDSTWTGNIKKSIIERAMQKFDGIIYTQKSMQIGHHKSLYFPDYTYIEDIYEKYIKDSRDEKVLCVGTMGTSKKIEELVSVFNKLGYPLHIAGKFYDENRFDRLLEMARPNIVLENRILSEDEYYSLLGSAKYSVMPYDEKEYFNRTSGVLQESVFLKTIPIAPETLLKSNGIPGIGYRHINDILKVDLYWNRSDLLRNYESLVANEYNYMKVKQKLCDFIVN